MSVTGTVGAVGTAGTLGAASVASASHRYIVKDLVSGYGRTAIVKGISLEVPDGMISVIIGANACGKSTLLKTMARLIRPMDGAVMLDGTQVDRLPTRRLACVLGLLPQAPIAPEGIAVADLVGRGRFPHQGLLRGWGKEDEEAVAEALEMMGIVDLADRSLDELSGGQRQRVWVAMALAQRTDILLLDEPTTFLDITHQVEILDLLTDLNRTRQTTIVMVLHDINLAARYADHVFAMRDGALVAQGAPAEVITEESIREVFALESQVLSDPLSASPVVLPKSRHHLPIAGDDANPSSRRGTSL
ncbi:MAG: ABC transporter ATP-binding protein [Coriobacteriales bacterium]|jgi:iron complex transport system ATP-binding protein|nr:ABC transporter ATP-binding protein [Coriobacteriales bacterium]